MFNTDPSTSVTIAWEQESGNTPEVYYGTTDYGTTWSSYPSNNGVDRQTNYMGMDNRFSRLTGLSPNTAYYFVIKDSQGTSQRYWFRTCPDVNTETLSFISGGDSRSGQTQRQNSNRMVADIRPHAVLFGGDLVNTPGNSSVQTWFDDWQLATTSDGQMIPIVHSFGNHEEYGTGGANFIYDLFDTSYDVYYNVLFGGDLFSMYTLNGEVLPGHTIANAGVRSSQTSWLQTTLSTDNSIWKAAQYHRPIVPHYSGKGEGSDEYTDWVNKFYDYGVRLVMESDAHVVKMTDEVKPVYAGSPSGSSSNWFTSTGLDPNKGITFIGEGSWGTIRTPDDSHPMTTAMASFYSFNWILVDACKMEIRTIDTQSPGSVPEHVAGDYTSISAGLEAQVWKPGALPSGVRSIVRCNPPIADFTAGQTNIFTGTTVNFTDLTANSPTSWSWDFGDGGNSTSQNPSYQYNTPGTYTVTLTVTNVEGSDDEIKIDYIIVVDPTAPTADFLADMTTASVAQTISFTDLSTGVPDTWSWDFGDGIGTSTLQDPSYAYGAPGTYTVTLTASNTYGSDDEIKVNYIVIVNGASVIVPVIAGNDDAEESRNGGGMGLTSSDLEIGNDGGDEQYTGVRFQNVSVPQGAIISNAYIRMRGDESDGAGSQLNIYIKAEDIDNAPQFTNTNSNISDRTLTTAQYTWPDGSIPGWTAGTVYDTPDLSTVVQEIVDRTGWASGNAMVFVYWSDMGESSERVGDSYEGSWPAELHFDYIIPLAAPPTANFTAASTSTCEGTSINFTDLSTDLPVTWSWTATGPEVLTSTNQNPTFNFTLPGTYNVELVATNVGGSDTYTENAYVIVNPLPTISAVGVATICDGDNTSISASGASTYSWNNGIGAGSSHSVSPASTTTYTVTGTDANGCENTDQVLVTVNALPTVSAVGVATICDGDNTSISGSGASTYSWDNGVGAGSSHSVSPSASTTYVVTGTDANGCENTDQVLVTVNALPTVSAAGVATICDGDNTSISGSGASTYSWDNGVGAGSSHSVSPSASTTYVVTGTDANGCENTDQVLVTVNALPTVSAAGVATICDGENTSISASGASTFSWDNGVGAGSLHSVSPSSSTTYTVTGTDVNGCVNIDQVIVTVNALPAITIGTVIDPNTCASATGSIEITGLNGGDITWNGPVNGNFAGATVPFTISGLSQGNYDISLVDANGCTSNLLNQGVNDPNPPATPVISANGTLTFCDGESVTLSSSYATDNSWSTVESTQDIVVTTSGTFSVVYTDALGCSASSIPTVVVVNALPASPTITANGTLTFCEGESVTLTSSEAIDNVWSTTETTNSIVVATSGFYGVTYTDGNGCVSTSTSTEVVINPLPVVTLAILDDVCETAGAFTLSQGTPAGGTYTGIGMSGGTFDPSAAGVGIHTITYSYQDANNCENAAQQTITVEDCAGLEDLEKLGYKLYPNPADNEIFIERSEDSENALVKIYDANGKLVFDMEISDNPMKIDVSEWNTGVYQIHMTVGNVQVVDRVIVK
jgi:PKD repeat protein